MLRQIRCSITNLPKPLNVLRLIGLTNNLKDRPQILNLLVVCLSFLRGLKNLW